MSVSKTPTASTTMTLIVLELRESISLGLGLTGTYSPARHGDDTTAGSDHLTALNYAKECNRKEPAY